jgi:hypothetical protein
MTFVATPPSPPTRTLPNVLGSARADPGVGPKPDVIRCSAEQGHSRRALLGSDREIMMACSYIVSPAAGGARRAPDLARTWRSAVAAAVDGCRYVLHVASPFTATQPKDPDELIVPARDGALRAAIDGGVERMALTPALAAIHSSRASTPEAPYTEGGLDRRCRHEPHPVHALKDNRRSRRMGLARRRSRQPAGDGQAGRDHRARPRQGPLLLPADDRAAAERHARHPAPRSVGRHDRSTTAPTAS